ncbi:MAG: COG1615 family transporter, partial [Scytonema sp. RU_4_4]|nr:COG1615 family transporter [Scytonema sp. RU_4_4]
MTSGLLKRSYRLIFLLLGMWLFLDLTCHLGAEIFWFGEVGYLREFLLRLLTQLGVWALVFFTSVGFLLSNFLVASRLKYPPGGQGDKGTRGLGDKGTR